MPTEDIHKLVERLIAQESTLYEEKQLLDEKIQDIKKKLAAVQITLELLNESKPLDKEQAQQHSQEALLSDKYLELRGLTISEALKKIASKNNGVLKVLDATKILVDAGFYSDEKKAKDNIYPRLSAANGPFHKLEAEGEYGLTEVLLAGI